MSDPDPADGRLESWKEIAAYLRRDVTTVQRWERREGMPVHRHIHDRAGSVHAFRSELDAWVATRQAGPVQPEMTPATDVSSAPAAGPSRKPRSWRARAAALITVVGTGLFGWWALSQDRSPADPLMAARFIPLTNFDGNEQAAAVSRDGKFVAFLSDRDGRTDVWVTQVGAGRFYNITKGTAPELINSAVRTLGFTPDGTQVTFWTRNPGASSAPTIGVWASPVLGGTPRPYLEGAAEFDWSARGDRLVFHTPATGDPMFVRTAAGEARQIFTAPAGLHAHFLTWSPDEAFIYFVQGEVPDRMDIWRIRPDGSGAERITRHDARVSHPVFADPHTLLYLATDDEGSGPWIHAVDVERREVRRVSAGLERYTSLAASADGRILAATRTDLKTTLWRLPIESGRVAAAPQRIPLDAGAGRSGRLGPGFLVYVSSQPDGDTLWKQEGDTAAELWRSPQGRIIGAPSVSHDGRRVAFCAREANQPSLIVLNADGTEMRVLTRSLALHGTPAWAPGDNAITVAAAVDGTPRLFNVPLDGSAPIPLIDEHATDPAWSPDGALVVYSGADVGTTFPVKALYTDAQDRTAFPDVRLSRGSRHLAFMPGGRSLLLLRGDIGHKNLWTIDLSTGAERQLTHFPPEFSVNDFAISPDGRELLLERLQERSDIVLIQRVK